VSGIASQSQNISWKWLETKRVFKPW